MVKGRERGMEERLSQYASVPEGLLEDGGCWPFEGPLCDTFQLVRSCIELRTHNILPDSCVCTYIPLHTLVYAPTHTHTHTLWYEL